MPRPKEDLGPAFTTRLRSYQDRILRKAASDKMPFVMLLRLVLDEVDLPKVVKRITGAKR